MRQRSSVMIGLGILLTLTAGAAGAELPGPETLAATQPAAGPLEPIDDTPNDPTHGPNCAPACFFCWCGTAYEDNCPLDWENDGFCDCCCQFPDTDDCSSCPYGEVEDCIGNCAPYHWWGDSTCDNGQRTWRGAPIYFSCPEMFCDDGACDPSVCDNGCALGEIRDCNDNCAPSSWLGDAECDNGQRAWRGNLIYFSCPEMNCDGGECVPPICSVNCPPGETADCNGHCAPEDWLGNDVCDNGQTTWRDIPIYFSCIGLNCDNGDCTLPVCGISFCPPNEIEDCNGNCAPFEWLGNSECDAGQWSWGGHAIYFNCPEANCDHGDCPPPGCVVPCPTGEVEDCNGNCAPSDWLSDGECDDGQNWWDGHPIYLGCHDRNCDNGDCPPDVCGPCAALDSEPPSCTIDARQPHDMYTPELSQGWDWVDYSFGCVMPPIGSANFFVDQQPSGGPPAPQVVGAIPTTPTTVRLQLSGPINPGYWTCFILMHPANPLPTILGCVGSLPADADGSRVADPSDIIAVIDHINAVTPRPMSSVDMDRSGTVDPSDIIRVIDLINGAGMFEPWMNQTLPPCPTG